MEHKDASGVLPCKTMRITYETSAVYMAFRSIQPPWNSSQKDTKDTFQSVFF